MLVAPHGEGQALGAHSRLNAEAEMSLSCRASQRATLTKVGKCSLDKRLRV